MQVKNQLFEEITKEYSLQILKWAYKKCGDSDRAEELAQEVMVQIFSAIRRVSPPRNSFMIFSSCCSSSLATAE